ncbi:tetratricopeptide repeat protein [Roseateles violae]|uniref:Sel1 repeat family protein n=1 Tax=Roseateles violae TaxID=3058042 RepID=A0ABT8DSM7_9BURK|nr:hypothetical protein [Pelomonas sp. PFR6]MDN3921324.1 hypothetical protein [Pelomonas sp. PFR6]
MLKPPAELQKEYLPAYVKAAEAGDPRAMQHLFWVYVHGIYVEQNIELALRWRERREKRILETKDYAQMIGVARGYYWGVQKRGSYDGKPENYIIPPDRKTGGEWVQRAAPGDTQDTNFWYGRGLRKGDFGEKNPREALKYLERAAIDQGYTGAIEELTAAYIELNQPQKAAPHLRTLWLDSKLLDLPVRDWFARLNVSWCGPRSDRKPAVVCDGSNQAPPPPREKKDGAGSKG